MSWILKNKKTPGENLAEKSFAKNKKHSRGKNWKALLVVLFLMFGFVFLTAIVGTAQATETSTAVPAANASKEVLKEATCGGIDFNCYFKMLLIGVFNFCAWIFAVAATLFAWVIDPKNVSGTDGMLNKQAVKDVWIMVRDLLNMTFILVLLFAAFCTIFQVSKWNLKKVWMGILINALLVNFSYPIARFFIDVSNVAFYYFVNHLFSSTGTVTGNTIFAGLNAASKLGDLLKPGNYVDYSIAYLIAMIIVVFIMGMTILVIAALFMVRLVALTALVMFSPIGFVGYIFPGTEGYANKWWNALISYSFFAPIMIFVIAISLRVMKAVGEENFKSFGASANTNSTPDQANWIAQAAFFAIPIIILWMGMGVAKGMSIAGASTVIDSVKKNGKRLADGAYWTAFKNPVARGIKEGAKERSGYNKLTKWWKDPSTIEAGVKGAIANAYKKDKGGFSSEFTKGRTKTRDKTIADENKKKISENAQDHIDTGKTANELFAIMNDKDKSKLDQAAAASAYQRLDHDDKRAHMIATISSAKAGEYGDHDAALRTAVHPSGPIGDALRDEQQKAKDIADKIKAKAFVGKNEHSALAAYINKQAKKKLKEGVETKA